MRGIFWLIFSLLCVSSLQASQVGTITKMEGVVQVFTHPSKTVSGEGPHVLYENEYYRLESAKVGDRVKFGNIVRTGADARARVVFENGDQYLIAPESSYRVKWNQASGKSPEINLKYGKIRAIIQKNGPRNRLSIKTKSAVMGVRGTDFYVSDQAAGTETEVRVLRGEVQVKPKIDPEVVKTSAPPKVKPIEIKSGFSATVKEIAKKDIAKVAKIAEKQKTEEHAPKIKEKVVTDAGEVQVAVFQTSKEELVQVQKETIINKERKAEPVTQAEKKVEEKVKALEKKAVKAVIADIKVNEPKLYAQMTKDKKDFDSVEAANSVSVNKIYEKAPSVPERRKPYESELDNLDEAYDKYFKDYD